MSGLSDAVVAWIRTNVPIWIGPAVTALSTWLFDHQVLWFHIDSAAAGVWAAGVVSSAWYFVFHALEQRAPKAGWMLGLARKPTYKKP